MSVDKDREENQKFQLFFRIMFAARRLSGVVSRAATSSRYVRCNQQLYLDAVGVQCRLDCFRTRFAHFRGCALH